MQAATATGGSRGHILRRHMLPLVWPALIGFAPVVAAMTLLTEAALSVLGIGVQPPHASWGTLIADGQTLIYSRPWVAIAPGLAVVITVLGAQRARRGGAAGKCLGRRGRVLVLFGISVLVFLIFFATPGADPAARLAGRGASPETLEAVRHEYGLDRSFPLQYAALMRRLFVTRDLPSFVNRGQLVVPAVLRAAPVTLALAAGAAVLWLVSRASPSG